jgi:transcriptional regulator with XRE-family HTH domain
MASASANKLSNGRAETRGEMDLSRVRIVRRGPGRAVRLTLRALRESSRKTQAQVAKKSGLAQPEISKLETAATLDDRMVATLRRYLNAIGDDLELVAVSKFGHRIGVAGAASTEQRTADESPQFRRLKELVTEARSVISEKEPFREGINVDNGAGLLQEALWVVVDAAGLRWKEAKTSGSPLSAKDLVAGDNAARYALPAALLRLAKDAFRNEGRHGNESLANDIATLLQALAAAWERGDTKALRSPSAPGMRDAPTRWAAKYMGERSASRTERKDALIGVLKKGFAQNPKCRTVPVVIHLALMHDCIKDESNGWPQELQSKLAKHVEKNGWPDDVTELVEKLLRLAGERDPLNTIHKRQRKKDRSAV